MSLATAVTGSGPRVVLVHGFTQTGATWRPLAGALAHAHEVVCVDAPGHGGSSDVRADLPAAAELLGAAGGRATYVGYSMGGRLALHLALDRPDLVERLVLVGATAGIDDPTERAERRARDEALADDLERTGVAAFLDRWLAQPLFATLPRDAADLDSRRANSPAGLASSLRLTGTGTMDPPLWDRLAAIAAPTLVVAGALDTRFAAIGGRLVRAVGANARLALIPDAGHACHLERPEAFLATLRSFLTPPG
ncbi:MAG: alpha/beta hydrolase [Acidimicrobiales bacterium]|nr:alpha/beta hydrolase [Acidimicrobiales bacterium]